MKSLLSKAPAVESIHVPFMQTPYIANIDGQTYELRIQGFSSIALFHGYQNVKLYIMTSSFWLIFWNMIILLASYFSIKAS